MKEQKVIDDEWEKQALPTGIEPVTFRLTAERSACWAKEADGIFFPFRWYMKILSSPSFHSK